jgi:hypothetical protein
MIEGIEMKHRKLGISLALGAVIAAGLMVSPASAATTTGHWVQHPTGTTEYQAVVQQPINSANTSNWSSKSKGAIPVMFQLQSRQGAALFQSIGSDGFAGFPDLNVNGTNFADDYSYLAFVPDALTFAGITNLQATYDFATGNCHGGSLRFEIGLTSGKSIFVYYGAGPNFTDCTGANNQSGVNMTTLTDARWDTSQVGGTFYDTHTNALTLVGSQQVSYAEIVLDSGWGDTHIAQDQILAAGTTATVNDNPQTWDSGGTGAFTATCDLPAATIQVGKTDPVADGQLNEEPVQSSLADSGNSFRVVDCKYQYILSIPSLAGSGTYYVEIKIGGVRIPTPASPGGSVRFDLR